MSKQSDASSSRKFRAPNSYKSNNGSYVRFAKSPSHYAGQNGYKSNYKYPNTSPNVNKYKGKSTLAVEGTFFNNNNTRMRLPSPPPSYADEKQEVLDSLMSDLNLNKSQSKSPEVPNAEKWFESKFLDPDWTPYQLFCKEFYDLENETNAYKLPPFLRPKGPRFLQAKVFMVNGHLIQGYKGRQYLACEGPTQSSVYDFYSMCWQENIHCIIMLNQAYEERFYSPKFYNANHETIQYWPIEPGQKFTFMPYQIECLSTELKARPDDTKVYKIDDQNQFAYRITRLLFTELNPVLQADPRELIHICYYKWPDGEIPLSLEQDRSDWWPSIDLLTSLMHIQHSTSPIVVHCHAGIGRTGALIAMDMGMSRLLESGVIDVCDTIRHIRKQRPRSVMNHWQYTWINLGLAERALKEGMLASKFKVSKDSELSGVTMVEIKECWLEMLEDLRKEDEVEVVEVDQVDNGDGEAQKEEEKKVEPLDEPLVLVGIPFGD